MEEKFTVTVTFTIDEGTNPYLQSAQAIEEEFESWLEDLRAHVQSVTVVPDPPEGGAPVIEGAETGPD